MKLRFWQRRSLPREPARFLDVPTQFLDTALLARLPRWDGPVPGPACESYRPNGSRCLLPAVATVQVQEADTVTHRRVCEHHR